MSREPRVYPTVTQAPVSTLLLDTSYAFPQNRSVGPLE